MDAERPTIALVTDAIHPYHRGGKELRYRELSHRLSRRAEVHVYTMNWWRGEATRRDGAVVLHALSPLLKLYAGRRRSVLQATVFALCCLRLLWRRFDVIEADHMPYVQLFPLRLIASLRRVPLVVTWHEHWGPAYWSEYLGRPGRLGWWLERAAMRLPDTIIAASDGTAERLREHLGKHAPVVVAPNGVNIANAASAPAAPEACDVVVVGRLLDHKRVDLLLDVVALLAARGQQTCCRVIGDGPERARLHRRARELGIEQLVDFRHDVHGERELFALMKAARVFVFPSAREGFGISVLEALACGLPVVTTSAPDNMSRHLVERSQRGIVCEPSTEGLAAGITQALALTPAAGRREDWLDEFDWDRVADRVAEAVLA